MIFFVILQPQRAQPWRVSGKGCDDLVFGLNEKE